MTIDEYFTYCAQNRDFDQRLGQWMMNVLFQTKKTLYMIILGENGIDPFYNDDNIPAFLSFITYNWEEY